MSFCFQLISGQYKHSTSCNNFEFRNAMQIPSGMLTGPVQADFPVLISTLFALLLSNLWYTGQILRNYSHSQQVCMFCCKSASILCPVLTFAPLFYIFKTCTCVLMVLNSENWQEVAENILLVIKWLYTPFWESSCRQFVPEIAPWKKSNMEKGPKKRPYMQKAPMGAFWTFLINYLCPQKVYGRSIGRFLNKLR